MEDDVVGSGVGAITAGKVGLTFGVDMMIDETWRGTRTMMIKRGDYDNEKILDGNESDYDGDKTMTMIMIMKTIGCLTATKVMTMTVMNTLDSSEDDHDDYDNDDESDYKGSKVLLTAGMERVNDG